MSICLIEGACGAYPLPLLDLVAATVVTDGTTYAINTISNTFLCDDVTVVEDCDAKDIPPEDIIRLVFSCDCCGNLAINVNVTSCDEK